MNTYRVLINGENFLVNFNGQPQKLGFYASRVVDANNSENAENAAMDSIRNDARLTEVVLNRHNDPPMLYVEEIGEIEKTNLEEDVNTGFSRYSHDEN